MKVAVFGLGYVGSVSAACLASQGHDVWGIDLDPSKVDMVAAGRSPVMEPELDDMIEETVAAGRLHATMDTAEAVASSDLSLLCVGTPSTAQGATDLSFVERLVDDLVRILPTVTPAASGNHAVVMRSTVPPGTVEWLGSALQIGLDGVGPAIGVAMCPEFLREGTGIADFFAPPFTVIGAKDRWVIELLREVFSPVARPRYVVDIRSAEALKYACNAFHATKVSFANELGRLFRHLDVDTRAVMSLFCKDRQLNISPRYLRPGFAFGGSCLPKDLRSLVHLGRTEGLDLPLLTGVLATNDLVVSEIVDRVVSGEGRKIALLGLSFKAGSDDLRESPYVDIAETLLGKGYEVKLYDPIVNPSALIGTNRQYVEARLPHLHRILTETPRQALEGSDVAIVPSSREEVLDALLARPPRRIIDLDGSLGPIVESLPGYEGVSW